MGILGILLPVLSVKAQAIKPLKIGDTVPDLVLHNVINYKDSVIRLSDFKGKLVVLDFWSAFCGPCVELFGHLMELKKQFGGKIEVILFNTKNRDSKEKIQRVLDNYRKKHGVAVTLPVAYDSRRLDSMVSFHTIPHELWISPAGTVAAITSDRELTLGNIGAVINGTPIKIRTKMDIRDKQSAHIGPYGIAADTIVFQSVFSGYQQGLSSSSGIIRHDGKVMGAYVNNRPLMGLVRTAYNDSLSLTAFHYLVESKNPAAYRDYYAGADLYAHLYCYSSLQAPYNYNSFVSGLKSDLKRAFHIEVRTANRAVDCLLLSTKPADNRSPQQDSTLYRDIRNGISEIKYALDLKTLQSMLDGVFAYPVVAGGGKDVQTRFNVILPKDRTDTIRIVKGLQAAGLVLLHSRATLPVCVISDGSLPAAEGGGIPTKVLKKENVAMDRSFNGPVNPL